MQSLSSTHTIQGKRTYHLCQEARACSWAALNSMIFCGYTATRTGQDIATAHAKLCALSRQNHHPASNLSSNLGQRLAFLFRSQLVPSQNCLFLFLSLCNLPALFFSDRSSFGGFCPYTCFQIISRYAIRTFRHDKTGRGMNKGIGLSMVSERAER